MVIIIFNFKMVVKQKKRIPPFLSLVIPSSDINRYQSPGYSNKPGICHVLAVQCLCQSYRYFRRINATTQKCIQITALVGSGDQVIEFPHTQFAVISGKVIVMDICPGHVIDLTVGY